MLLDWAGSGVRGAAALVALERERQGGEDESDDAQRVEVLKQLAACAAAGAAAEGGDDDDGAHTLEGGVDDGGVVLERRARRGGLPARAAPREAVAAEEGERHVSHSAGLRVGVEDERADAGAEGAQDAARDGGAAAAHAEQH